MNAVNSYTTSRTIGRPSVTVESRLPYEERSHYKSSPEGRSRQSSMQPQRVAAASASTLGTNSGRSIQPANTQGQQYSNSGRSNRNDNSNSAQSVLTSSSSMSQNGASSSSSSRQQKNQSKETMSTGRVWKSAVDPKTGRTYYYDAVTRETQWRKPVELASDDEKRSMARKEKKEKDFFSSMEQNILRNLQLGSCMPPVKQDDESLDHVGQLSNADKASVPGANPKLAKPKSAVRTISQMDHTDIIELTRLTSTSQSTAQNKENDRSVENQSNATPKKDLKSLERRVSPRDVMEIPDASEAGWFGDGGVSKDEQDDDCAWFDCGDQDFSMTIDRKESEYSILSSDSTDEDAERALQEIERAAAKMSMNSSPPAVLASKSDSTTVTAIKNKEDVAKPMLRKRNTCGTLYVCSTMSAPDKDATIKCISGVLRAHLLQSVRAEQEEVSKKMTFAEYEIFNDVNQFGQVAGQSVTQVPTLDEITKFYRDVFLKAQMETDCIIMSLVYVERLIKDTNGGVRPHPRNWRSILFSSMILSSKVWDDLSMWNADFSQCVSAREANISFTTQRINELERAMLNCLKYNVKVGASEYAKYYFLLRSMLIRSGLGSDDINTRSPLDVEGAKQLELRSSNLSVGPLSHSSPTNMSSPTLDKPKNRRVKSLGHTDLIAKMKSDDTEEVRSPSCVRANLEQIIPM